ncbi:unnamed protein product [Brassicogethes aeneus]|uniref:Multidrug resistance-associated protein lethal(2)03659 n=1 Tax=Brassicogethes aeneus TaxID=1431903 RepID=A0A9P0AZ39_BRAAE|nr:unnamed protein product [Brassicogethes aeneus]
MDRTIKKEKKLNPAQTANPVSSIMFLYMFPIFTKSYKKQLSENDLFAPLEEHKSNLLGDKLENYWKEEYRSKRKYPLHRALIKQFGPLYVFLGLIKFADELLLVIVLPYLIEKLVSFFESNQHTISKSNAYFYAGMYVVATVVSTCISHPCMMGLQHLSMKIRVACSSLIYRKSLRLSKTALGKTTVGHMVNLLSNDVSKFDQGFVISHFLWIGPIEAAIGTYLLYQEIGIAALFGTGFLISFVPIQAYLAKRCSVLRLRTALKTDERCRLMNEIISGIQVIKMYCWEKSFAKLIALARRNEMKAIREHSYIIGLMYSFEIFVSRTGVFICVIGYILMGGEMEAQKVFAVTAIYNLLKPVVTILFSLSISSFAEVHVTVNRVNEILTFEEVKDTIKEHTINEKMEIKNGKGGDTLGVYNRGYPDLRVALHNVNAKWLDDSPDDTLSNISVSASANQLLAVIGPVGSGKSSLLNVVLKELPIKEGKMEILGKISFSSQEPWLFSASVRDNILFGNEYDEDRYERVIDVCALRADLAMFPFGDKTLVGEKGKALSGGQKARINLARCVYKRADIYLLDDPLSAVDAHVGKHLYDKCIKQFLSNKIRILVTHQLQYLKSADKIIILDDGQIQGEGKYAELQNSGMDFGKLLEKFSNEDHDEERKKIKSRQNSERSELSDDEDDPVIAKEHMGTGGINAQTYWQYLKAGGSKFLIILLFLSFILCQVIANGGEYYLTYWVNYDQDFKNKENQNLTKPNETFPEKEIIYYYSGITLATIIIAILKSIYYMLFFAQASVNLHDFIFNKIIKATMRFYNENPSGRILNRFSKDLGIIDEYLPSVLIDVLEISLQLIGVVVLSAMVEPLLLLPSAIFFLIIYFVRTIYIKTSRCVKRLEAIKKSPMLTHVTASINGLTTIRAFNMEKMLINEFDEFQDEHSSAWFLFLASGRCFGFWLDILCVAFAAVGLFSLIGFNDRIYAGDIGLIITQFMGLMASLQWGMRQWSELENQMTSVERVLEYTKLESEPERNKSNNLPIDWPEKGAIEFKDIKLKYNENENYVLKGLSFSVKPMEKVGIVGRTGAGKSSTISALFQLYPLQGSIFIDHVDATNLPLDEVRSKISIIPQEPVLFSGSMRKNLDPFEEYSDETLWNALEQVEMKETIAELPSGLSSTVMEGGSNFSIGERQLVCLARALIRNNKILVLDEATANVDPHTDALIQNTIRNKFANCSVLTIAHRLNTVMDSHKILVMDAGRVVEFDHPHVLLKNEHGVLTNMVDATGSSTSKLLKEIAENNYINKEKSE